MTARRLLQSVLCAVIVLQTTAPLLLRAAGAADGLPACCRTAKSCPMKMRSCGISPPPAPPATFAPAKALLPAVDATTVDESPATFAMPIAPSIRRGFVSVDDRPPRAPFVSALTA